METTKTTAAQLQEQIEKVGNEILGLSAELAEYEQKTETLRAEKEQAVKDRALYIRSHASYNGDAPKPDPAEVRFNDNQIVVTELRSQIEAKKSNALDLEGQRRASEYSEHEGLQLELEGKAVEAGKKASEAIRQHETAKQAAANNIIWLNMHVTDRGDFRKPEMQARFLAKLLGERAAVPA